MTTAKEITPLTQEGILALAKAPITATLSFLDFPHIRIEQQHDDKDGKPFFIGTLSLNVDDQIIIEMAGATAFREALAIIAYHQQLTKTALLINDDFVSYAEKLPPTNPLIDRNGKPITPEMMSKEYRKSVDYRLMEMRMKQEQKNAMPNRQI